MGYDFKINQKEKIIMEMSRSYILHCARSLPNIGDEHICSKLHGHTFSISICLKGNIDSNSGMIMDIYELDKIFNEKIHSKLDHSHLNEIDGLSNPTTEHLVIWIWETLKPHVKQLYTVTGSEEKGTEFKYFGK